MLQLKVIGATILKARPEQSSQLPEADKQAIAANTVLNLQSYAVEKDHIKVVLADQVFKERKTWYVYGLHAQILQDGVAIALGGQQLRITTNTFLKAKPIQSTQLPDNEKQAIRAGTLCNIQSYTVEKDHLRVELAGVKLKGLSTWYVYAPHAQILDDGKAVSLSASSPAPTTPSRPTPTPQPSPTPPSPPKNATIQLKVLVNTLLKLRPIQAAQLPDAEEHPIAANTVLNVESYAVVNDHIRVALADQVFNGRNTWYIYGLHGQIVQNGVPLALGNEQMRITADTFLKARPVASTQLKDDEKEFVKAGSLYDLQSYALENDHIRFVLAALRVDGRNTLYVYKEHAQILDKGKPVSLGSKELTEADYQKAAALINVPVAAIKAVVRVETSGGGFFKDGRPKILFEAAWFSDYTKGRYDASHPNISSRRWNPNLYIGGPREYDRLAAAMKLDRQAALMSASWGLGQVMGGNYKSASYDNVEAFVKDMYESEGKQLLAMVHFIKSNGLADKLRKQDWAAFAYGYNGPGYRANNYDVKLRDAFRHFSAKA